MLCIEESCEKLIFNKKTGLCGMHYYRQHRGSEKVGPDRIYVCSIEGCERKHKAKGLCGPHYVRLWKTGSVKYDQPIRKSPVDGWQLNEDGYFAKKGVNSRTGKIGTILQHRVVMEEKLGRSLRKGETVHHRNLIRTDNRPENLELWASRHPRGARVVDLVEFAREILAEYGDLVG